jgi:hypothetical protein
MSARNVHGVLSGGSVVLATLPEASGFQHIMYLLVNKSHQESLFHNFVQQRPLESGSTNTADTCEHTNPLISNIAS